MNDDLIANRNETAIARSVRNLIMTLPGDKPFEPTIGSNVSNLLFDNMDELTAESIRSEIENTIRNYEPRVDINEVVVKANFDENEFDVKIVYYIVGIDALPQELTFALQPTR